MKSKIYINLIFGVVAFVIGLVYFINHEQRIGKFIILVAVCAEIRALVTWYFYKSKNTRLSKEQELYGHQQFNRLDWDGEEKEIIQKGATLADLYSPVMMPADLLKAHRELDKAVDLGYRFQPFASDAKRMEFLFELYERYTANLFSKEKVEKIKRTSIGVEL